MGYFSGKPPWHLPCPGLACSVGTGTPKAQAGASNSAAFACVLPWLCLHHPHSYGPAPGPHRDAPRGTQPVRGTQAGSLASQHVPPTPPQAPGVSPRPLGPAVQVPGPLAASPLAVPAPPPAAPIIPPRPPAPTGAAPRPPLPGRGPAGAPQAAAWRHSSTSRQAPEGASVRRPSGKVPADGCRIVLQVLANAKRSDGSPQPLSLANIGDRVLASYTCTLRQLAKAAGVGDGTARGLLDATPGVGVVGATAHGDPLYQVTGLPGAGPESDAKESQPRSRGLPAARGPQTQTPETPAVYPTPGPLAAPPGHPTKSDPAGRAAASEPAPIPGGRLLTALGKEVKGLVQRSKLAGLGTSLAAAGTVAQPTRNRVRPVHLVVHLSSLLELLCAGKATLNHGGALGAFEQDMHLLAYHCTTLLGGKRLGAAAQPVASALFAKLTTTAQTVNAATVGA